MQVRDTIFALSSGALPSGVAIIRISGSATHEVLQQMTSGVPKARHAVLSNIKGQDGAVLDRGLCLFFPGPASFTGEDCAELHLHGGRAVVAAVLDQLAGFPRLRMADAGEFTKRAFLNGKMDLTGAEALSDLITAETEAQRRFALVNSSETHRRLYGSWRRRLIHARAMIEAELDFADESDVPGSVAEAVWQDISNLSREISDHASSYKSAEIIRDGFQVVILGAPNAGKSSLLNALAKRDVAIVTDEPGTTRDILEVSLDIAGMKIVLADTAGIREAGGRVEALGIERSIARAREADLILLLEDVTNPSPVQGLPERPILRLGNKADLASGTKTLNYDCLISAKTGQGLDELLELIQRASAGYLDRASDVLPFRARHVALLNEAVYQLQAAVQAEEQGLELSAESLRAASDALGRITGEIDVEDLLDTIFSTFCIGK
ncbi:tRNA uridine-5-carboxymethylaminomethyl(34) synthesis GTPase MnmE [Chelativorans sp. J32]|uniref:tRNA uridine-5-carboxymethylaminomethyl(34) synthesis GTPase MnmE n=1 Tax=Chelativorans sp. J32 TaxID=935840 RepID=UPI000488AB63|nr:tRNA uridine-5-carboxymethylaminomethyl(34) synthesis GTPase MnmE [Chelativorans sp. J32]